MDWLLSLLIEYHVPLTHLSRFLATYAAAVEQVMGQNGERLHRWLQAEAARLRLPG